MKKHTILFLAANPRGTDRRALDREARAIQVELERSGYRDCFELETRWAAEPLDLLRELRKLRPTVVHFSGHGGPDAGSEHQPAYRDVAGGEADPRDESRHGLLFHGADGSAQVVVSTAALERTIEAAGTSVKLVVLSACYSEAHAAALLAHVDCVVGMSGSIDGDAARSFASGFYGGLGERESVEAAYKQGCAAISLDGLPDADRPQLRIREGVDTGQLVFARDSPAGAIAARGGLRRWLLFAAAPSLLLVTLLMLSAGVRRTVCRVPGLRSVCAAVGIGDVPTPAEQALWDDALAQDSCEGLRAYVNSYPQGVYTDEARSRLDGFWVDEKLGAARVDRYKLVINQKGPFPTEEEARQDAKKRGDEEAPDDCKPPGGTRLLQLVSAWAEPHKWNCSEDKRAHTFTCGFDGWVVCQIRDWIKSERCGPRI